MGVAVRRALHPARIQVDSCQHFTRAQIALVRVNFRLDNLSDDGDSFMVCVEVPCEDGKLDRAVVEAMQELSPRLKAISDGLENALERRLSELERGGDIENPARP